MGFLLLQIFLLFPTILDNAWKFPFLQALVIGAFSFLVVTFCWLSLKPVLLKLNKLKSDFYSLQRFKSNASIFSAFLLTQKKVKISQWEYDLQIGNRNSSLQLVMCSNPFCNPCAEAHKVLHKLAEMHKNELGIIVRFALRPGAPDDRGTKAVRCILRAIGSNRNNTKEFDSEFCLIVLKDWFELMDIEKFAGKYGSNEGINVDHLLLAHAEWTKEVEIDTTPTFFFDGYKIPMVYSINDLRPIIRELLAQKVVKLLPSETLQELA
jgi:hypothetical protein